MVTQTVDEFEDKSKKKTNKKYTKEQFEAGMQIDAFMMNGRKSLIQTSDPQTRQLNKCI